MAYAITTPIPAGAGQRSEPTEQDVCLQCEFWECAECYQILDAETTTVGCCCGDIPAVHS